MSTAQAGFSNLNACGEHLNGFEMSIGSAPESVTVLLERVKGGDRAAFDRLIPLVYRELHRIASGYLRRESPHHTLQPTALIHEAYVRLVEQGDADYHNRKHFFAAAAQVMRRILVDHARTRLAAKRGPGLQVKLDPSGDVAHERDRTVIALDDALAVLAEADPQQARLVEMRFFGGMTAQEIADCAAIPVHIVRRELRSAQIRLRQEMEG